MDNQATSGPAPTNSLMVSVGNTIDNLHKMSSLIEERVGQLHGGLVSAKPAMENPPGILGDHLGQLQFLYNRLQEINNALVLIV